MEEIESLAESDHGSYFNQSETWPEEVQEVKTATASASHLKIYGRVHGPARGSRRGMHLQEYRYMIHSLQGKASEQFRRIGIVSLLRRRSNNNGEHCCKTRIGFNLDCKMCK